VGVGPVRAAAGTARFLATERPNALVLVGTAGTYGAHPPGTVVVATEVLLDPDVARLGLGYVPLPPAPLRCDAGLVASVRPHVHAEARVLTVSAIANDPTLVTARAHDAEIEHMEAWAVAWACAEAGVPFVAVLGVSNAVGPGAHAQWRANREVAEAAARAAVAAAWTTPVRGVG
jgi:purine-nucleoside phosphorylase